MIQSEKQIDALTELINIAFGKAAASLSELTRHRVFLETPKVTMFPMDELKTFLQGYIQGEIATVHQIFQGQVAGDALLLLNYEGAVALTNLLTDETVNERRLNTSSQEALIEIGNVLLNACLGTFGNLLEVQIIFSVPRLHLQGLTAMLDSLTIEREELRYALIVSTKFRLRDSEIVGYLVIILGVASLDRLLRVVETLG
ncbi:MAG: chemotaxis protein CheC [Nitrospirota bacterium]